MSEDKGCTKDSCWSVGTIYDPRELPVVSVIGLGVDGVLHVWRASTMNLYMKKFDDHDTLVVFLVYDSCTKAWCFYDSVMFHVVMSWDIVFDKPTSWS
jgi:hypothetical protein